MSDQASSKSIELTSNTADPKVESAESPKASYQEIRKPPTIPGKVVTVSEPANNGQASSTENDVQEPPVGSGVTVRRSIATRFAVPVIVLLLAGAILFSITHNWNAWTGAQKTQRTDDAFLRSDITPLSTRISGTVLKVAVEDYQSVKAGDLLVLIKDDDYRAQVEQAEAIVQAAHVALDNNLAQKGLQETRIAQARTSIEGARADITQTEANIDAAKADLENTQASIDATQADVERTQLERSRQEALLAAASATKQRLEQVVADEERFRAVLGSRQAERNKAHALIAIRQADLSKARAAMALKVQELEAQQKQRGLLDVQEEQLKAELSAKEASLKVVRTNLEYTRIVAPTDGIVGERKVREGQLVSPGMQVLSLVQGNIWIQANYKETQLTNVRKGDVAEATVDAFPGIVLRGRVEEIAPASGSQFALLPPDNASGNFTKVAQRVPVKIVLEPNTALAERLRPGMSVIADIRTSGSNTK
jgi:membrane fusion protein (multidrug efflux system)